MSAANDILNAVKAITEAAFPGKKCHLRRASEKNPLIAQDMTFPCFAATCNDDRPTEMLWAGKKGVKYPVELMYLTKELPGQRDTGTGTPMTGSDIEAVLDAASKLFLAPRNENGKPGLRGVPVVSDCKVRPLGPYKLPFGDQTVNCSRILLTFETIEDAK